MNLVFFLLSFLFASYAPTTQTTTDDGINTGTTSNHHQTGTGKGKGKGSKYGDGDYIICNDILP